jgi:hypothetical protein
MILAPAAQFADRRAELVTRKGAAGQGTQTNRTGVAACVRLARGPFAKEGLYQ